MKVKPNSTETVFASVISQHLLLNLYQVISAVQELQYNAVQELLFKVRKQLTFQAKKEFTDAYECELEISEKKCNVSNNIFFVYIAKVKWMLLICNIK